MNNDDRDKDCNNNNDGNSHGIYKGDDAMMTYIQDKSSILVNYMTTILYISQI